MTTLTRTNTPGGPDPERVEELRHALESSDLVPELEVAEGGLAPLSSSRTCFALSGLAFSAAAAGCVVNSALTGWMGIAGMTGIGLFYLGLGVLSLAR